MINTTLSISLVLAGLALPQAFLRWYLRESDDDRDRARVLATTLGVRLAASAAGAVAVSLLAVPLVLVLYGDLRQLPVFVLIGPILFFDSLLTIPLALLRAQRRARHYALLSFARAVTGSVLIVGLVVGAGAGVAGVVVGSGLAAAVAVAVATLLLWRAHLLRLGWDGALARRMLAFALPLVPAGLAGWTLNLSDRYLLQAFTDASTVGVYALGYTAGIVVNALAVQPFTVAWGATYWELARRDDAPATMARVLSAYAALATLAALALAALGTDVIRLLVGEAFEASRFVVPFSAFAYVLYGAFIILTTGLNIASRTGLFPPIMGGAAALGIVLNLVLIPILGFMGAAVSTLVAYTVLAVAGGVVAQRLYPVPWQLSRVVAIVALGLTLSAAALVGPDHVLWRLAAVAAYAPLAVALGLVRLETLRAAARSLRGG